MCSTTTGQSIRDDQTQPAEKELETCENGNKMNLSLQSRWRREEAENGVNNESNERTCYAARSQARAQQMSERLARE